MNARAEINDLAATAGVIAVPSLLFASAVWAADHHFRRSDFSLGRRHVAFALISLAVAVLSSLLCSGVPRLGAEMPQTTSGGIASMLLLGILAFPSVSFVCASVAATAAAVGPAIDD